MVEDTTEQINPLDVLMKQIDIVGQYLGVHEGLLEKLKRTKRDLIVHFPVKIDEKRESFLREGPNDLVRAVREASRCTQGLEKSVRKKCLTS